MKQWTLWVVGCVSMASPLAQAQNASALDALRSACAADAQKFCAGVPSGGGLIIACLKQHKDSLTNQCRQAGAQYANANTGATAPSAPSGASTAASVPVLPAPAASAKAAAQTPHSTATKPASSTATNAKPGSYLRVKQVQIVAHVIDPVLGNGTVDVPAIDMLIPSDWTFKGYEGINSQEGCIFDTWITEFSATSADGATSIAGAPNTNWQYADDPTELRKLADPARRQMGGNGKPCPIGKPLSAEDFFRQKIAASFKSTDSVLAVEPYPQLVQIARMQMGLPADAASDHSGTRVDAIRAHIDSGKNEGWVALAVVTRVFRQGAGAFYDCHSIDVTSIQAPKGQLDGDDMLFRVLISSVRAEPKWQSYSGNYIAKLYQAEAQKQAAADATWANFQNYAAQMIMATTANQMRGSFNSAFAADQNIRGVQTFRDPSTGKTMELSNLYDHAWSNGSDGYVMSEDPNFNPNGNLNGQWNQLQPVHPAP